MKKGHAYRKRARVEKGDARKIEKAEARRAGGKIPPARKKRRKRPPAA